MHRFVFNLIALLTAVLAGRVLARQPLEAEITSVSGQSIYLDKGGRDGVRPELIVRIPSLGVAEQFAIVIDVAPGSCRAELQLEQPIPELGTTATIEGVQLAEPPREPKTETPAAPRAPPPAHPPWQRQIDTSDPATPLLAPAKGAEPDERPTVFRGRIFSDLRYTRDTGGGRHNDYSFFRLGARLEATNPLHLGDRLVLHANLDHRGADLADASESDTSARIDRLSWSIGGHRDSRYRAELGRFQSIYVPEVGLLDGGEGAIILENGLRLGIGLGLYPAPFEERDLGQDYGFHVFASYQPVAPRPLTATIAYQQTWHDDTPDQNLIVARFNAQPVKPVTLTGLALVNLYTESDTVKGSGAELTQGQFTARYAPTPSWGTSVSYSRTRYPEIRRRDFDQLPEDLLRDGQVDRVSASAWARATDTVRLTIRGNRWEDQSDDGYAGEAGAEWREVLRDSTFVRGSVYLTEGSFTSGRGARLVIAERIGEADVGLRYDIFLYTLTGMIGADEDFVRHLFEADVGWRVGSWRYGVDLRYSTGDQEESLASHLLVEYRF